MWLVRIYASSRDRVEELGDLQSFQCTAPSVIRAAPVARLSAWADRVGMAPQARNHPPL
jgi:hypothetical protein